MNPEEPEEPFGEHLCYNGCVVLYHSPRAFENDIAQLVAHGWGHIAVKSFESGTVAECYDYIEKALKLPPGYGSNLNALNDCLRDLEFPDSGHLAISLPRFDLVARNAPRFAQKVLNIMAINERPYLLEGRRLLYLVQSDEPRLHFEPVGGHSPQWNPHEQWGSTRLLPRSEPAARSQKPAG